MEEKPLSPADISVAVDRFIDIRHEMENLNKEAIAIVEKINGMGQDTTRAYEGWYRALDNCLHNDGIRSLADMDETIDFLIDLRDSELNQLAAEQRLKDFAMDKAKQGISFTGYSKHQVWTKFSIACRHGDMEGVDCWYTECLAKGITKHLLDTCVATNGLSYNLNPQGV